MKNILTLTTALALAAGMTLSVQAQGLGAGAGVSVGGSTHGGGSTVGGTGRAGVGVGIGAQTSAGTNSPAGATVGTGLGLSGGSLNGGTGGNVMTNSPAAADATVRGTSNSKTQPKQLKVRSQTGAGASLNDRSRSTSSGVTRADVNTGVYGRTDDSNGVRINTAGTAGGLDAAAGTRINTSGNAGGLDVVDTNPNVGTNVGLEVDGSTASGMGNANIRSNVGAAGSLQ